ncbi:unnamed protein product, partial [Staurois parvus]
GVVICQRVVFFLVRVHVGRGPISAVQAEDQGLCSCIGGK